nr:hypothetical protein [Parafrankia sp. EUN1f]
MFPEVPGDQDVLGVGEDHPGHQVEGDHGIGLVEAAVDETVDQRLGRHQDAGSRQPGDQQRQRGLTQQHAPDAARVDADGVTPVLGGQGQVLELVRQCLGGDELEELLATGHVVADGLAVHAEPVGDGLDGHVRGGEGGGRVDDHLPADPCRSTGTAPGAPLHGGRDDVPRPGAGAVR